MSAILQRQQNLVEEFQKLTDWEARYKLIIEKGKKLAVFPENEKSEDLKVKGCQSQVWLKADLVDGHIQFKGDSDAMIVKGLIALLLEVYSGGTPDEILSNPPDFIKKMGLDAYLSPSRANGLFSMAKQIQFYALAFKSLLASRQ
ncbi:MAG: SufE family protein [Bdellovibrionota bacterium]